jgi:hypothetical protein
MGVVEQSSGAVESQLSVLENSYESFSTHQRTVSVPSAQYENLRTFSESKVEVHAKVTNDCSEVLHVDEDGEMVLPSTVTTVEDCLEKGLCSTVEESTGIRCRITEVVGVTILGVNDRTDPDRETVYQLAILFDANRVDGSTTERAVWKEFDPDIHPAYF